MKRRDVIKMPILAASSFFLSSRAISSENDYYGLSGFVLVDDPPFNGNLVDAYNSIPESGGVALILGARSYNIYGLFSHTKTNTKKNIAFIGSGVPSYNKNTGRMENGSGTIILGSIFNSAPGFQAFNFGLDVSDGFRSDVSGGNYCEGLVIYDFGENSNIRIGNLKIHAPKYVPGDFKTAMHCLLIQNGGDVVHYGTVECIGGYHGYVDKSIRLLADDVICWGQSGTSLIFKSDEWSRCFWASIKTATIGRDGEPVTAGIVFEAQDQKSGAVNIGTLMARNVSFLIRPAASSNQKITDIHIDRILGASISGSDGKEAVVIDSSFVNFSIGTHEIISSFNGGIRVNAGVVGAKIGSGEVKDCGGNGYSISSPVCHGKILSCSNSGWGVLIENGGVVNPQDVECLYNGLGGISSLPSVPVSLLNNWSDTSGSFRALKIGSMVRISGEVRGGAVSAGNTWQPVARILDLRPSSDEYLSAFGTDSNGNPKSIMCKIDKNGVIHVYGTGNAAIYIININGFYVSPGK